MKERKVKIVQVVGARPNFMKVAPIQQAFSKCNEVEAFIVHTGQHKDVNMSDVFFRQLDLPQPKYFLGVQAGSHSYMTAQMMVAFEEVLLKEEPDLVVVVGDVTSTLACALTSVRNKIPVAHVEAGLRSFDRDMPEEINRILTDQISDYLFITEESARKNLIRENIPGHKIFFTGNCMIDSLVKFLKPAQELNMAKNWGLAQGKYALMTMHRPTNVDTGEGLSKIIQLLEWTVGQTPVVFPVHPRTKSRLKEFGLWTRLESMQGLIPTAPLGYLEFISLLNGCKFILTDSGGIQEETSYLGIPCLTFRRTTERPVTVEVGSNRMIEDLSIESAILAIREILHGSFRPGGIPELWDGHAGQRIVDVILSRVLH